MAMWGSNLDYNGLLDIFGGDWIKLIHKFEKI